MPDSLNARMAEALAPVLGEAAVYRAGRCQRGHLANGAEIGGRCGVVEHGGYPVQIPLSVFACGEIIQAHPVDFADPAVGWGLWERWHVLPENETCEMVVARNIRRHFLVRLIFPEASGRRSGYGYADRILSALLDAWARAMGVGEVSGDA